VHTLEAEEEAAKTAKLMKETAKKDRLEELGLSDSDDDEDERIAREDAKLVGETPGRQHSSLLNLGSALAKGKLWKNKAHESALKHGSMLDADRAQRREQSRRYHKVMDEMRRKMTHLHKAREGYADEQADWQMDVSEDKAKLKQFFEAESGKMERACAREIK
jgi:hypothetical protein